jgi:hypothetical protein
MQRQEITMNDTRSGIGRQHGLTTHRPAVTVPEQMARRNLVIVLACVLALLGLYVVGSALDIAAEQRARAEQQMLIESLDHEADMLDQQLVRETQLAQLREAYAQGQRDAMAAVRDRPEGVALLQACRAMSPTKKGGV